MDHMRTYLSKMRRRTSSESGASSSADNATGAAGGGGEEFDDDDLMFMHYDFMMHRHRGRRHMMRDPSPERNFSPKELEQRKWRLPELVNPDSNEETMEIDPNDQGILETDATLYTITEVLEDSKTQRHCVLKMPSEIPPQLMPRTTESSQYNILMADGSGSMGEYFHSVVNGWNNYVAPKLKGRTSIFTFSNDVRFIRSGTEIRSGDINHSRTDLTGALMKMAEEVYQCKEKYVKVFLVTDGHHNETSVKPNEILEKLKAPSTKVVDVFVLGAGDNFPVKYSITLRSLLHSGSSNIPSLFWARFNSEVLDQLMHIAAYVSSETSQTLTLSQSGFALPGTIPKSEFHMDEWVYFPTGPEQVQNLTLIKGACSSQVNLRVQRATVEVLNKIFRQWNSILIQMHNKKQQLPPDALPFMKKLFKAVAGQQGPKTSIRERLNRKEVATHELEFETLMNKVKAVLTKDSYSDELELAENILSTTVSGGKYESKVLQLKGHTDNDFHNDVKEFMKTVTCHKEAIMHISITPEDCCRITMTSTLSDIQDEDLPELMETSKFEFLKEFTISGIGVTAPMRDSVTINPWSFGVKSILSQPYTIVSQKAMESFAATNSFSGHDKEVQLKADDDSTRFNAVVPVFPPEAAKVMEPIVQTRLYAMCTTFAILKNPHIVDFNIHFAALGVLWVRLLHEYPTVPRPEYVQRRIQSIESTAELYLQRTGLNTFWRMLKERTPQALMTESTETMEGHKVKCESLIKPMFILHLFLRQEKLDAVTLTRIIKMLLLEYIGRCLSHYKTGQNDAKPFTEFFAEELTDHNLQQEWADRQLAVLQKQIGREVRYELKDFYRLELVERTARREIKRRMQQVTQHFNESITIILNKAKVERLRSVSSAGDVSWPTLRTFVDEIGLPQDTIQELFSEQNLTIYTTHALEYRNSRERLSTNMPDYQTAISKALTAVQKENSNLTSDSIKQKLIDMLTSGWIQAYKEVHSSVVQPMTPAQIVAKAQERGISVTEDTFDQVYRRYRPGVGLLGNACQSRHCPFFLVPDRRFNQHISVERRTHTAFPHTFHLTAYQHRNDDVSVVASNIASGTQSRSQKTIAQEILQPLEDSLASLVMWYQHQGN